MSSLTFYPSSPSLFNERSFPSTHYSQLRQELAPFAAKLFELPEDGRLVMVERPATNGVALYAVCTSTNLLDGNVMHIGNITATYRETFPLTLPQPAAYARALLAADSMREARAAFALFTARCGLVPDIVWPTIDTTYFVHLDSNPKSLLRMRVNEGLDGELVFGIDRVWPFSEECSECRYTGVDGDPAQVLTHAFETIYEFEPQPKS